MRAIALLLEAQYLLVVSVNVGLVIVDVSAKSIDKLEDPPLRVVNYIGQLPVALNDLLKKRNAVRCRSY